MIVALALLVCAFGFVLDFADTQHKLAIESRRAHAAAAWSVFMYLLGTLGTLAVFRVSALLVIPEAAGLYLGSLVAVRRAASVSV